jgi:hypothetical protein
MTPVLEYALDYARPSARPTSLQRWKCEDEAKARLGG